MNEFADTVLTAVADLDPAAVYALTALFMVIETSAFVGLVVPGDLAVLVAGTTATDPARFAGFVVAATGGSLVGESLGYMIGRRFGTRLRGSRLGRRLGEQRWARAEAFLNGRGGSSVAASRFVAVAHALVPVLAGAVRMPYRRYIAWTAAGSLIWSITYVAAGAAAGASYREYSHRLSLGLYAVLAGVLAGVIALKIIRHRHSRQTMAATSKRARAVPRATTMVPAWGVPAWLLPQVGWIGSSPGHLSRLSRSVPSVFQRFER